MNNKKDPWIWIDNNFYPERQLSRYTGNWDNASEADTVVEFSKRFSFGKKIERVSVRYSADASVQMWINDRLIGTGPVWVGGDFLANDRPRRNRYATVLECVGCGDDDFLNRSLVINNLDGGELNFFARVRLFPVQLCEFSVGRGGFMLEATVHFADGDCVTIITDPSWHAELCPSRYVPATYDGRLANIDAGAPVEVEDVWQLSESRLPLRVERRLDSKSIHTFTLMPGEQKNISIEYDKIYAGYLYFSTTGDGVLFADAEIYETSLDVSCKREKLIFSKTDEYIGSLLYGIGLIKLTLKNNSDTATVINISINEAYLPSSIDATTLTDVDWLNKVLNVAKHTLKYCRQYIHLDSPKHCEPSACAGDYYIESLMSSFSYADMRLADFDVVRIAEALIHNDGLMFHPTYSLIWVRMLLDVYMRNGRIGLLEECRDALSKLLYVFDGYVGELGIIDTPPNYMFVDWIYIDDISLHHPPKALGQGVINMFYYDALLASSQIYAYLGDTDNARKCTMRASVLRDSINKHLYDAEAGLYFEGLNTPTPEELINHYMPENVSKRYYRVNTNALAVAFGVADGYDGAGIMRRILDDLAFDDYQPYFAHFVLKAVHVSGLDAEYAFKILEKWRAPIEECDKGLAEGFIAPEPGYIFDHSHAWGGTPLYSLPMALTSLEILKPGMSHIRISPNLLDLGYAKVDIPTPHGIVVLEMKRGDEPKITVPDGVTVDLA